MGFKTSMRIKSWSTINDSVLQRDLEFNLNGETVPAVLWTPTDVAPKALIAIAHGGGGHKKSKEILARAVHYCIIQSWASLAVDAPSHGERVSVEEAEAQRAISIAASQGVGNFPRLRVDNKIRFLDNLARQAVPEWRMAIDIALSLLQESDTFSIGFLGLSQGSSIGIPLVANDKRFIGAVFGLVHLHPRHTNLKDWANNVHVPIRFIMQWDDQIRSRRYGLALYNEFGSPLKSLHINPGGHLDVPQFEKDSWESFFLRCFHEDNKNCITRS